MSPTNAFVRRARGAAHQLRAQVGEVAAPVYALAQCFSVRILVREHVRDWAGCKHGPAAGAVHLGKRALFVEDAPTTWRAHERAVYLHELTHILFAHPSLGVLTPEDMIQLQAEHRLALAMGLGRDWAVDTFQLAGPLEFCLGGADAEEVYETAGQMRASAGWRAGLRRAQRLGVLDEQLLPTGCGPTWEKLTEEELARLRHYARRLLKRGQLDPALPPVPPPLPSASGVHL